MSKVRKPGRMPIHPDIYADFDAPVCPTDCYMYIGGLHYGSPTQIHLTKEQARHLARWMAKVSAYLEQQSKPKTKKST